MKGRMIFPWSGGCSIRGNCHSLASNITSAARKYHVRGGRPANAICVSSSFAQSGRADFLPFRPSSRPRVQQMEGASQSCVGALLQEQGCSVGIGQFQSRNAAMRQVPDGVSDLKTPRIRVPAAPRNSTVRESLRELSTARPPGERFASSDNSDTNNRTGHINSADPAFGGRRPAGTVPRNDCSG